MSASRRFAAKSGVNAQAFTIQRTTGSARASPRSQSEVALQGVQKGSSSPPKVPTLNDPCNAMVADETRQNGVHEDKLYLLDFITGGLPSMDNEDLQEVAISEIYLELVFFVHMCVYLGVQCFNIHGSAVYEINFRVVLLVCLLLFRRLIACYLSSILSSPKSSSIAMDLTEANSSVEMEEDTFTRVGKEMSPPTLSMAQSADGKAQQRKKDKVQEEPVSSKKKECQCSSLQRRHSGEKRLESCHSPKDANSSGCNVNQKPMVPSGREGSRSRRKGRRRGFSLMVSFYLGAILSFGCGLAWTLPWQSRLIVFVPPLCYAGLSAVTKRQLRFRASVPLLPNAVGAHTAQFPSAIASAASGGVQKKPGGPLGRLGGKDKEREKEKAGGKGGVLPSPSPSPSLVTFTGGGEGGGGVGIEGLRQEDLIAWGARLREWPVLFFRTTLLEAFLLGYLVVIVPVKTLQEGNLYFSLFACFVLFGCVVVSSACALVMHELALKRDAIVSVAAQLGCWHRVNVPNLRVSRDVAVWSEREVPYGEGAVVQHEGKLFVSLGRINAAHPASAFAVVLFLIQEEPLLLTNWVMASQFSLTVLQLVLVLCSRQWEGYAAMAVISCHSLLVCFLLRRSCSLASLRRSKLD